MERRFTLPNLITLARILACPVIAFLALAPGIGARTAAFVLFLAAALSDLWDGYLARKHGWITDIGKLLDPLADKLLLAASFIPLWIISNRPDGFGDLPFLGRLPIVVLIIIFGREIFVTAFRQWAASRGQVLAAGRSGKYKALYQNFFAGGALLWYPIRMWAEQSGWVDSALWPVWYVIHGTWIIVTLLVALVLTVTSMISYIRSWRADGELS